MGLRGSDEEQSRAYYRQAAGTQAQSTWHDIEKYRPSLGSVRDDDFCLRVKRVPSSEKHSIRSGSQVTWT